MSTSQNGWKQDPGVVRLHVGGDKDGCEVRAGDVAKAFTWLMQHFHDEVEPLTQANGYRSVAFNNATAGSIRTSNHTSGTAVDLNGAKHPNQVMHHGATSGFTAAQTAKIRALLKYAAIFEWGADFPTGTKDFMHFAIARGTSAAQVAAFIKKITPKPAPTPEDPVTVVKPTTQVSVKSGTDGQSVGTVIAGSGKTSWTVVDFDTDPKKTVNTVATSVACPRGGLLDIKMSLAQVPVGATVQARVYRVDTDSAGKSVGVPVPYEIIERTGSDGNTSVDWMQTFGKPSPVKPATQTRFRLQVQVILPTGSKAKPQIRSARVIPSAY